MVKEKRIARRGLPIPLLTRMKIRNLYLIQDLPHRQIAVQTGLSESSVGAIISRSGWVEEKRAKFTKLVKKSDAQCSAVMSEVVAALADESKEIAMEGLGRARKAVGQTGKDAAKNFQSWTGGVRNLVQVVRAIEGGSANTGSESAGPLTMNLFFSAPVPPASEPKTVIPLEPS